MGDTPTCNPSPHHGRSIWRQVLVLALPALAQQYLFLLVRLCDQFFSDNFHLEDIGQRPAYLAALTTAGYLYWFVSSYTILVSVGATALVARFVGAGDWQLARRATGQAILLAIGFGLLGTLAAHLGLSSLIEALQLTGATADYCSQFLMPLVILLAFQMTESACIACLAGAGDTHTGLKVLGLVALLNIPLAFLLCFGIGPWENFGSTMLALGTALSSIVGEWKGLGFVGIALGTALSHVTGCLVLLVLLARGRSGLKLRLRELLPDLHLLLRLLRVSVPAGIDSLSVAFCQLWFLSLVNQLGDNASAAHGIAIQWEALGYLAGGAFGTAAMAIVGQNLGARNPAGAARGAAAAFAIGAAVMIAMGIAFVVLAVPMFKLFCHEDNSWRVIEEGVPVLRLIACAMPALASQIIFISALRGAGDTRVPILINWFGFLGIRIPLAYLLTRSAIDFGPLGILHCWSMGLIGAWIAMCIDIWVRGLFFAARFLSGRWKKVEV